MWYLSYYDRDLDGGDEPAASRGQIIESAYLG